MADKEIAAKTIVVEREYVDRHFLEDYAAFYARCFQPCQSRCTRLHFFSEPLSAEQMLGAVGKPPESAEVQHLQNCYLGFCVARPLPDAIIGRTALRPFGPDGGRRHYPCDVDYKVNLHGIDLLVKSMAFQEQDTVLAACATVALWCCFNRTQQVFHTALPSPAEITNVANQVVGSARPIPSHGLVVEQMCNAIRRAGLEPEVYPVTPALPLPSLLFGHLKAGFPVLLGVEVEGVGMHAIAVNGYSLLGTKTLTQECAAHAPTASIGLRINEFYAHDDQIGPFSRLRVHPASPKEASRTSVILQGSWLASNTKTELKLIPHLAIVPLYHKVRINFVDVQSWISRLSKVLNIFAFDYEWEVWLSTTNRLRQSLVRKGRLSQQPLQAVLLEHHPKWVWRARLVVSEHFGLELLFDATEIARGFPVYKVIWYSRQLREGLATIMSVPALESYLLQALTRRFLEFMRAEAKP